LRRARLALDLDLANQAHAIGVDALERELLRAPAGQGLRAGISRDEQRGQGAREDDEAEAHEV